MEVVPKLRLPTLGIRLELKGDCNKFKFVIVDKLSICLLEVSVSIV